jgi:putative Holliday junction resolvase
MSYLGLDVGDVRVGVAGLENLSALPHPIGTFARANSEAETEVLKLIAARQVGLLVVGLPLGEQNERTSQCESVEKFCRRILRRAPAVQVAYVDEYASTRTAEERFREARAGHSSRRARQSERRGYIDALAAVTILETYLQSLQASPS